MFNIYLKKVFSNRFLYFSKFRYQDERLSSPFMVGSYPTTMLNNNSNGIPYIDQNSAELIPQPHHIQILDSNGNVTNSVPAYLTPDGRQVILQEIEPAIDYNATLESRQYHQPAPAPKSLIIQQKVAPSAYQTPTANITNNSSTNQSSAFHSTSSSNNVSGSLNQINRDTPSRLTTTSSAVNLSSSQIQKQNQQLNREISTGSVTSLPGRCKKIKNFKKYCSSLIFYFDF